jgi:hypothetical protein
LVKLQPSSPSTSIHELEFIITHAQQEQVAQQETPLTITVQRRREVTAKKKSEAERTEFK